MAVGIAAAADPGVPPVFEDISSNAMKERLSMRSQVFLALITYNALAIIANSLKNESLKQFWAGFHRISVD